MVRKITEVLILPTIQAKFFFGNSLLNKVTLRISLEPVEINQRKFVDG